MALFLDIPNMVNADSLIEYRDSRNSIFLVFTEFPISNIRKLLPTEENAEMVVVFLAVCVFCGYFFNIIYYVL